MQSIRHFGLGLAVVAALAAAPAPLSATPADPQVLPLWKGAAPGSESWRYPERATRTPAGAIATIANVREPTMTVYLPDATTANGAAVVILPGGALRFLGWDSCVHIAEWLNSRGVAAFIVKYRTLQVAPTAPGAVAPTSGAPSSGGGEPRQARGAPSLPVDLVIRNANANPSPGDRNLAQVLTFGVADAQNAMRMVRRNAASWKVDPRRVGILGISAGGGVAMGVAMGPQGDAYPDFLISFYGPALQDVSVPAYAPPLLMGTAAAHQPVTNGMLALHSVWQAAGKPSELHIYDGNVVEGSFRQAGAHTDSWSARILEWMTEHGILKPATAN